MKLYSKLIIFVTLFTSINWLYADDIIDEVRGTNSEMHKERMKNPVGNTELLAKKNDRIFSGTTYGINFNKSASDEVRQAVRESITHSAINNHYHGKHESIFNISTKYIDDNRYLHHEAFLYLNRFSTYLLLNNSNAFLWTNEDLIRTLKINLNTNNSCPFMLTSENSKTGIQCSQDKLFQQSLLSTMIKYSDDALRKILGNDFIGHYLNLSRQYADVPDQWLVRVRDINMGSKEAGVCQNVDNEDDSVKLYKNSLFNPIGYAFSIPKDNRSD